MNLVALAGRLTAEPELCYTEKGIPYCRAVLAVDRDYKTTEKISMINAVQDYQSDQPDNQEIR